MEVVLGAGAKVSTLVKEVITNASGFERVQSDSAMDLSAQGAGQPGADFMGADLALAKPGKPGGAARPSSHRLVVQPHFPYDSGTSHGCKLCPANLCKVARGSFVHSAVTDLPYACACLTTFEICLQCLGLP